MPYTILNMKDVTDFIAPDNEDNGSAQNGGITVNATLGDPASSWDFTVDDIDQTINVQNFQPVIVFDENAPPIGGVATVPSMNFLLNPSMNNGTNWSTTGGLSGNITFLNASRNFQMTFSNNAVDTGAAFQQTLAGYVQPGVEYMLSGYLFAVTPLVNIQAFLELAFLDIFGNNLGATTGTWIPTSTQQRLNITAVAPANAAFALIVIGGQTTNTTNSGTFTWGTIQFEPMWFANKGVSYPTPDCNKFQVNCVQMPDGTCSRRCRLFAGYVEDHVNAYVGKERHTAVQCASSSKILETVGPPINASFTSTQDTSILSNVVSGLAINTSIICQLSTGQQNQFAPTSTLINGVVIDSISFTNSTLRDVCNGMQAQSGSLFYVDAYYYLWYVPPSFVGAVVELSDNPDNITSFAYDTFSVEYDSTNPVNSVRVSGTKQAAAAITDLFSGNGSTTVFSLTEPPDKTTAVTVGGSSIRTGVDGVDNAKFGSSLTYKALINKQKQTIQFATAPASGTNNVAVTYTYEDQAISDVISADAVADQKAQFWGTVSDSNITSTTGAKFRGLKELGDYAFPRTILTLSALDIYLPVGSLILFTCASENMSQTPFVVQTVASDFSDAGGVYHWNYTAGVYNPTLIDHLRNVTKAVKKTPTTANVAVVSSIDVAIFDSFHLNDSVTTNYNGAPAAGPYVYGDYATLIKSFHGLQAYYKLNDTNLSALDYSGHGYTGTIASSGITEGITGPLTGDSTTGMQFSGNVGANVTLPTALNTAMTGVTSLSVALMFQAGTFNTDPFLVANTFDGDTGGFIVAALSNEFTQAAQMTLGNGTTQAFAQNELLTWTAGHWYLIVGTWDGTTVKVYWYDVLSGAGGLDTTNEAALSGTLGASNSGTGVVIGFGGNTGDYGTFGLSQVAIYKNTALSATQISALLAMARTQAAKYGFASYS